MWERLCEQPGDAMKLSMHSCVTHIPEDNWDAQIMWVSRIVLTTLVCTVVYLGILSKETEGLKIELNLTEQSILPISARFSGYQWQYVTMADAMWGTDIFPKGENGLSDVRMPKV